MANVSSKEYKYNEIVIEQKFRRLTKEQSESLLELYGGTKTVKVIDDIIETLEQHKHNKEESIREWIRKEYYNLMLYGNHSADMDGLLSTSLEKIK